MWAAAVLAHARAVPAVRRAYSEHDGERQETRAGAAREEKRWRRKWLWVAAGAELGFERGDARLQGLVLLTREPRHLLDRLEFLTLDHVEVAQDAVGLVAEHRVELAPHAGRDARRVVHEPCHFVEETVGGLGHRLSRVRIESPHNNGHGLPGPQGLAPRASYIMQGRGAQCRLGRSNWMKPYSVRYWQHRQRAPAAALRTSALRPHSGLTSLARCPHHPGLRESPDVALCPSL